MFGPARIPNPASPFFQHDMEDYLRSSGLDKPRLPAPDIDKVFSVSQKSHFIGKLGKLPRAMAIDPVTGLDPWTAACPCGRLFVAGFEPDRAMRLFRLERTGPRGQRATEGSEYAPGTLWHLRTPKVCLVIQGYRIVGRETAMTKVGDEEHVAIFQLLERPIDFSFAPEEWERFRDPGALQDLRIAKAIAFTCPGSTVRRDMRDRRRFHETGSYEPASTDPEAWLNELEAAEGGLGAPRAPMSRKMRAPAEVPVQSVGEIFKDGPADSFLAGITKD